MLLYKMTCKWAILQRKLFILKKVPWTFPCGPASCSSILALCISWWGNFYEQDIMIKLVSVLKLTWCVFAFICSNSYCPGGPDSDFEYSTQSYTGYEVIILLSPKAMLSRIFLWVFHWCRAVCFILTVYSHSHLAHINESHPCTIWSLPPD